ncbi:MAG: hypothetical protein WC274_07445 [Sulfurimonas sp.]|jgi:hypothetical protein
MKKYLLKFLIVLAVCILIIIFTQLLNITLLISRCFHLSEQYFPLWAALGVIISALMATTSSMLTIDENRKKSYEDGLNQIIKKLNADYQYQHIDGKLEPKDKSYPEINGLNSESVLLYELQQFNYYLEKLKKILENKKFKILINSYAYRLGYINNFIETQIKRHEFKDIFKPFDIERKKFLFKDEREYIGFNSINLMSYQRNKKTKK